MAVLPDRRAAICEWLRTLGVNPADIPLHSMFSISTTKAGRILHYEAIVRDDDGHLVRDVDSRRPATEARTVAMITEPPVWWQLPIMPTVEQVTAERDGAYRERAHLVALLAAMTNGAVIAPAPDVDEPGWQIAYLTTGGTQASWHIAPRDADLFSAVEHVAEDDPRAQWDGHTTEAKYQRIQAHTSELLTRCGPAGGAGHTYIGRCEGAPGRH